VEPAPTIISCNGHSADDEPLRTAAEALREGELVVFPTETVYGLGANALSARAVARIFEAKGRPAHNPLIVHASDADAARALAAEWPDAARRIAHELWPGPITVVVRKADCVPDIVTAGGPTVAIRVPDHPVALRLIALAGVPVAAPSANPSGMMSPTRVEHLDERILASVRCVMDAGPCIHGIESTVVDLTTTPPVILRPGAVTRSRLERIIGKLGAERPRDESGAPRSPGTLGRHYAPQTELILVGTPETERSGIHRSGRFAWVTHDPTLAGAFPDAATTILMPPDSERYASRLYEVLQQLDRGGYSTIMVHEPPETPDWEAVLDRLRRAALR
jgi:L-threonylcarbamoyladenylate synthase